MFKDLMVETVEVYVDDIIVKSRTEESHADDLEKVFKTLKDYRLKLNPEKCVFGVKSGKFLGFMISERGIEANPEKIDAVIRMEPPKTVNEVQRLNGRVNALGRFISFSAK